MEKDDVPEESKPLPPPNYGPATAPEDSNPVDTTHVVTTMVPTMNLQPGNPLVTHMAQPSSWMPEPIGDNSGLPGISHLAPLDRLVIFRQVEVAKGKNSNQFNSLYSIRNSMNQAIFEAVEEACNSISCCSGPEIETNFFNFQRKQLFQMVRQYRNSCACCCLSSCLQEARVILANSQHVCTIRQTSAWSGPNFHILNATGNAILSVTGPNNSTPSYIYPRVFGFNITSLDLRKSIGTLLMNWAGQAGRITQDRMELSFPQDLDSSMKLALACQAILIYSMLFVRPFVARQDLQMHNQ